MQYSYSADRLDNLKIDVVVCFTTEVDKISGKYLKGLDDATGGGLGRMVRSKEFTGGSGDIASFVQPPGFKAPRLLLVGLGEDNKLSPDSFRRAMGEVARCGGLTSVRRAAVYFGPWADKQYYQATVEGYLLGGYKLLEFKSGDAAIEKRKLNHIKFVVESSSELRSLRSAVRRGVIIADGQLLARTLTQTPAGDLTPRIYARQARKLARQHGFQCRVLDKKAITREKMGALLGVAAGSVEPPCFIILKYNSGKSARKPVVLVGKGVTFDSGGISLKPGLNMHEMKQDMSGSAVVLATIMTAARLRLPLNLVGLMPCTENMPSGKATRPGDILTSRKGKTIEIINTDAEGRLILADALDYANKFKPQAVIDIATLTGAALYVLGYSGAPIMGSNDQLLERIEAASEATAERVWRMPIWDDFREQMKSKIADLVNSGGRPAGTMAAGAFLENFIGDWPWAHIDIAYMDLEPKGQPYIPVGATGFGVRLLTEVLVNWKKL